MEYKILEGYSTSVTHSAKMKDLEQKVAKVLSASCKTLGGVCVDSDGIPYQAVMSPRSITLTATSRTVGTEDSSNPRAGGGASRKSKSRKSKKSRKL